MRSVPSDALGETKTGVSKWRLRLLSILHLKVSMEKKSGDRIAETWTSFSVIRRSKGWKIKVKICLPILFHAQNHLTRPVKEWKRFGFVCDRPDKKSFRLMLFFFYFQLTALKKHTIPNPRHTKVSFLLKVNVIKQLDNNVPKNITQTTGNSAYVMDYY